MKGKAPSSYPEKVIGEKEDEMNCYYHPKTEAVGMCVSCGKPICAECKVVLSEKFYCNPCADKSFSSKIQTGRDKVEAGVQTAENTSGHGGLAVIPKEIQGWNWGAFVFNWIWAICNNVWIGLLAIIPYAGFVMAIILGVKGNEWAWQKKRWDSVEHFKKTQSTWNKWGIGLFIAGIVIVVIIIIASVV